MKLSLPARAYLLACDPDRGRVRDRGRTALLVRAAALAGLLREDRVADQDGRVAATGHGPTGDLLLDEVLTEVAGSGPATWRSLLRHNASDTLRALELQLAAGGVLRRHVTPLLRRTVFRLADPAPVDEVRSAVAHALRAPVSEVDAEDAVLTALAAASGAGVGRLEARRNSERLEELGEAGGEAVPALRQAVRQLRVRRAAVASSGGGG